ncbi:hypothetical protein ACOSP7_006875 [Xanthoceras sorbifolium]
MLVADFIDKDKHSWSVNRLKECFSAFDCGSIMSIPLSFKERFDDWVWHFEKKWVYSVQNGYILALSVKSKGERSDSSLLQKWWKVLWHLNIPPKVRIFIWRLYYDVVPALLNLVVRKILVSPLCPLCGLVDESTTHALFWCKFAKAV